jgi:hypothetical protein
MASKKGGGKNGADSDEWLFDGRMKRKLKEEEVEELSLEEEGEEIK